MTYVAERGAHDDGVVAVLFVVVEDLLHGLHTRVFFALVARARLVLLVPVENAADEGRDEGDTSLCAGDGLSEAEEEGEVAVDAILLLELARGLDTLPSRSNLDQDALLLDTDALVERDQLLRLEVSLASRLKGYKPLMRTFAFVAALSKDRRASTSVETRPGIIFKISLPNSTS